MLFNWTKRGMRASHSTTWETRLNRRQRRACYRPKLETLESRVVPAVFLVTNTNDAGPGSLRSAMIDANNTPNVGGPDRIEFNIPGSGVHIIQPTTPSGQISALPVIHDPVIIDGYTQGQATSDPSDDASPNTLAVGDNAVLKIQLDGSMLASGNLSNLTIAASGVAVQGLMAQSHLPCRFR